MHTWLRWSVGVFIACLSIGSVVQADARLGAGRLSVRGNGFIELIAPDGSALYATATSVRIASKSRILVGKRGYYVAPTISVPRNAESLRVRRNGHVSVTVRGTRGAVSLGTLAAVTFAHPEGLEMWDGGLYRETDASGPSLLQEFQGPGVGELIFKQNS